MVVDQLKINASIVRAEASDAEEVVATLFHTLMRSRAIALGINFTNFR